MYRLFPALRRSRQCLYEPHSLRTSTSRYTFDRSTMKIQKPSRLLHASVVLENCEFWKTINIFYYFLIIFVVNKGCFKVSWHRWTFIDLPEVSVEYIRHHVQLTQLIAFITFYCVLVVFTVVQLWAGNKVISLCITLVQVR